MTREYENTISREAFEQVCKERDIAIEQLHELGYEWGQKIESCNDAISREATLRPYKGLNDEDTISVWLIRKNIEQQPPVKPQYTDDEIKKMQDLEQAEIQKAYKLGKAKTGHWIPVSESLPSEDEDVMAWVESGDEARIACCNYAKEVWFDAIMDVIISPIAWMPLPAPFEPQESEEV